jgi:hypothetical protein
VLLIRPALLRHRCVISQSAKSAATSRFRCAKGAIWSGGERGNLGGPLQRGEGNFFLSQLAAGRNLPDRIQLAHRLLIFTCSTGSTTTQQSDTCRAVEPYNHESSFESAAVRPHHRVLHPRPPQKLSAWHAVNVPVLSPKFCHSGKVPELHAVCYTYFSAAACMHSMHAATRTAHWSSHRPRLAVPRGANAGGPSGRKPHP